MTHVILLEASRFGTLKEAENVETIACVIFAASVPSHIISCEPCLHLCPTFLACSRYQPLIQTW